MGHRWLVWAIVLGVMSSASQVFARPAEVFTPYLDSIRQRLPPNYEMRLPSEILLGGPGLSPDEMNQLVVKVIPTGSPARLTIGLFTCTSGPYPCLVGSFAVESAASLNAERELRWHRQQGDPITLADRVKGYLREGQKQTPASEFSSLMWQQNQMIYTISFLAAERQNILYMAHSMAIEPPILSIQTTAVRR